MSDARHIRITHKPSGEVIAEGPLGWGITQFEGNYYIRRRYLKTRGFTINFVPGLCFYKFLYVWLNFSWPGGKTSFLGWLYWLPNPLLPFIWYRIAVSNSHPELDFEYQNSGNNK